MFLKYEHIPKIVNLDNFDCITVVPSKPILPGTWKVVATRAAGQQNNPYAETCLIKEFSKKKDALAFYIDLEEAWLNKNEIFSIN